MNVPSPAMTRAPEWDGRWPPFSTDAFLEPLRSVYFPNARPEIVECAGVRVRTLVASGRPVTNGFWPYPFYLEPLGDAAEGEAMPASYLDTVVIALAGARDPGPRGAVPSPFIDWRGFESWDGFLRSREPVHGLDSVKSLLRKVRRIERELAPVTFQFHDPDPEALQFIFQLKRLQYRRTGIPDRFADPRMREFFDELNRRGQLIVSTLRSDGRLLSGNISSRFGKRLFLRMAAYDTDFADYSAGSVMLFRLAQASFEAGDEELDYLIGAEPYKFVLSTHVRWVGPIGREPLVPRVRRQLRARAGNALNGSPLYAGMKRLERRFERTRR